MFKDLSIKGRVLLLTLLPTSLLALVLGGYFTWVQLSGLQTQLLQRGEMLIEHLAPLAAPALEQNDVKKLERIAQQALLIGDVVFASTDRAEQPPTRTRTQVLRRTSLGSPCSVESPRRYGNGPVVLSRRRRPPAHRAAPAGPA